MLLCDFITDGTSFNHVIRQCNGLLGPTLPSTGMAWACFRETGTDAAQAHSTALCIWILHLYHTVLH